jgi:hypothetical protein
VTWTVNDITASDWDCSTWSRKVLGPKMTRLWDHDFENEAVQELRILMLGAPEVMWHGKVVNLTRRQTRALLYRLAARQEPVSRDHLCFLFWPDATDLAARRCLTHLLTHLRLALQIPDLVIASGDAVYLNSACAWVDTVCLHQMCCAQEALPDLDLYWRALDLIRGSFLEGFSLPHCPEYELWIVQEQQHWNCQILRLLSKLAAAQMSPSPGETTSPWQHGNDTGQLAAYGERFLARAVLHQLRKTAGNPSSCQL